MTSDLPSGSESAYTYEFDYKPAGRRTPNQPDGNDSDGWKNTVFLYWGTDNWNDRSNQVTFLTWDDNNYMNAGHGLHGDPVRGQIHNISGPLALGRYWVPSYPPRLELLTNALLRIPGMSPTRDLDTIYQTQIRIWFFIA